ncbi:hypothetical protein TomTYG45_02910 [Sphingobium sp. TomTYG45]
MTLKSDALRWGASILVVALAAGGAGYWAGHRQAPESQATAPAGVGKVLYWYDPMFPNQKFDKPGKSPFMDMQLVPRYAGGEGSGTSPAVTVDPSTRQSLGLRVVEAKMGSIASTLDVTGTVDFNQRDVAIIQARSGGSGCGRSRGGGARRRATPRPAQGDDGRGDPCRPVADPARIGRGLRGHEPDRRADDRRHADRANAVDVRTSCRLSFAPAAEEQALTSTSYFMKEKTMNHARLTIALTDAVKVGDKVDFDLTLTGNAGEVTAITKQ